MRGKEDRGIRAPWRVRERGLALGIDIGGTKVAGGIVDIDGRILTMARTDTPSRDARAVEQTIGTVVDELTRDADIVAIGIGAAGWMDTEGSSVMFSPHLAWRNEPLQAALQSQLRRPVLIENDANAAAWAEWRFGAGQGENRLLAVTLGTGIGGGIIIDGRVERGRYGAAGEFGHMVIVPGGHRCECGNRGCWEQYASGNALGREARELARAGSPIAQEILERANGNVDEIRGPLVTEAARNGDRAACDLFTEVGDWFGLGLANLAAAFDPGTFVIGGGVSSAGELLMKPTRESFARNLTGRGYRPAADIRLAHLGPDAGLVGAADLARVAASRRWARSVPGG
ncbi:ROK family glucokinase [Saxibacter everestensis]|uniref:Glucokinase n=1 Tax=Saxibacter everestensis TaxID=2909229 RepID=A0ABY8QZ81_9MICO|nr:ROK family glucokinase [Brevibacteriaceae bacterium ZFBP1038]